MKNREIEGFGIILRDIKKDIAKAKKEGKYQNYLEDYGFSGIKVSEYWNSLEFVFTTIKPVKYGSPETKETDHFLNFRYEDGYFTDLKGKEHKKAPDYIKEYNFNDALRYAQNWWLDKFTPTLARELGMEVMKKTEKHERNNERKIKRLISGHPAEIQVEMEKGRLTFKIWATSIKVNGGHHNLALENFGVDTRQIISMTAKKSFVRVAKDLKKRLLDKYLEAFPKAVKETLEKHGKKDEAIKITWESYKRMAKVAGSEISKSDKEGYKRALQDHQIKDFSMFSEVEGCYRLRTSTYDPGKWIMELEKISEEKATQILQILKGTHVVREKKQKKKLKS